MDTFLYRVSTKKPIFLKKYSSIPFIISENKIQVEGTLFRKKSLNEFGGYYEIVKDGISVIFDLEKIRKDSDGDGLTDILEKKLMTNPFSTDTDGDGIPDNLDLNPRFNLPRTEKTVIYETILSDNVPWDSLSLEIPFFKSTDKSTFSDTINTIMIVTDNPDILAIEPTNYRIIFVSAKEYESEEHFKYETGLEKFGFSPLFKVDSINNAYTINYYVTHGSYEILVIKSLNGWQLQILSSITD